MTGTFKGIGNVICLSRWSAAGSRQQGYDSVNRAWVPTSISRVDLLTQVTDCRVCNRRRIKCDRRLPACGKCEKRGLTCTGYGLLLKWDQGVASRGKLKGQSLPIKAEDISTSTSHPVEVSKSSIVRIPRSGDQVQEIAPSFSLQMNTIPQQLLTLQLQKSDERHLLHHYDHIVASNMAWVDCHENPWRHIIIPLALESPPLLNAILAFAAKHINAVSMSGSKKSTAMMPISYPERFQQKAVKLLAREIQEFAAGKDFQASSNTSKDISRNRSNAILATMLVLCNVETVWPG